MLDRIAALRAEKDIRYVLERDTLHDKLEAVFFDALGERNHAAAVAALRLQALLGGLALRPGAEKKSGNAGVLSRRKLGKARMRRRKMPGKVRKSP